MNRQQLEGKWMQLRGEAKRRWSKLTDDDLALLDADLDKFAGRIVELYGIAREQVAHEMIKLIDTLNDVGRSRKPSAKD